MSSANADAGATAPRGLWAGAACGFLVNCVGWFPGVASFDSDFQYQEALTGRYSDWHPPVMGRWWSVLHLMAAGNAPLFLFHLVLYWSAIGLIATTLAHSRQVRAAWITLAVASLPTLVAMNVQLVKDVGMSVTLLAAFAISFAYRSRRLPLPIAAAAGIVVLVSYAILVRVNAIFAAAPLIVYSVNPSLRSRPVWFCAALASLAVLAIAVSGAVNRHLLAAVPTHPIRSLQIFDVTGIALHSKDVGVFGPDAPFTVARVQACYDARTWDTLAPLSTCHEFWDVLGTTPGLPDAQTLDGHFWYENPPNPALSSLWLAAIVKHPMAYVTHRLSHFNSAVYFIVPRHHADRAVLDHLAFNEPLAGRRSSHGMVDLFKFNPLVTPVSALALGVVVLTFMHGRRSMPTWPCDEAAFFLIVSGMLYSLGFSIVGVSSDLRYQFWPMLAVGVGASLTVPSYQRSRPWSRNEWLSVVFLTLIVISSVAARVMEGDAYYPRHPERSHIAAES